MFPGKSQYARFNGILHKVLKNNEEDIMDEGFNVSTLGTHSVWKGSETLCSSGCTVSPPMESMCLCTGWSMGGVKDRYFHYDKAGDQFVGRTVTGISNGSEEFYLSPVFWKVETNNETNLSKIKSIVDIV